MTRSADAGSTMSSGLGSEVSMMRSQPLVAQGGRLGSSNCSGSLVRVVSAVGALVVVALPLIGLGLR